MYVPSKEVKEVQKGIYNGTVSPERTGGIDFSGGHGEIGDGNEIKRLIMNVYGLQCNVYTQTAT